MLKQYSRPLDVLIASVILYRQGKHVAAAKFLAKAAEMDGMTTTLQNLDKLNEGLKLGKEMPEVHQAPDDESVPTTVMGRVMSRAAAETAKKKAMAKKKPMPEFLKKKMMKDKAKPKKVKADLDQGDEDDSPEFMGVDTSDDVMLDGADSVGLGVDPGTAPIDGDDLDLTDLDFEATDDMEMPVAEAEDEDESEDDKIDEGEKEEAADESEEEDDSEDDEEDAKVNKAITARLLRRTSANLAGLDRQVASTKTRK